MNKDSSSKNDPTDIHARIEDIFDKALELPPDDRDAFLQQHCGDDLKVFREVQDLLAAHDRAPSFIERPGVDLILRAGEEQCGELPAGRQVGRYTINRLIATGGIGAVYEAQQENPQRRVALKVLRLALSSPVMRRRFHDEAQILGRLRHPHIAQIYEAGAFEETNVHIPYFAMELIPNARTITEHAQAWSRNMQARIELFITVCDAVHYGHMRGVIHRDLKPGNILVDDQGVAKVIDFGIARATDVDIAVTTRRTGAGELIGTLPYMSPEQCDADPDELDTRTDVYSLGVVLFELLTGELPHDLPRTSIVGAIRVIKEDAGRRLSDLDRTLGGDLETIVEKALAKERNRRYSSAAEFALDLRRFVKNEPIVARPPSTFYVVGKFVRRHRGMVAGLSVAMMGLLVGATAAVWQAVVATNERDRARDAERRASVEAKKAGRINDFLQGMLASANPLESSGDVSVRSVLDEAAKRITAELGRSPEIAGSLERTIGVSYLGLADYDRAENHLQQAVSLTKQVYGDDSVEIATAWKELARLYQETGRDVEAEALLRKALSIFQRKSDTDDSLVATTLGQLGLLLYDRVQYGDAEPLLRDSLRMFQATYGPDDLGTANAENNLAMLLRATNRIGSAQRHYREALRVKRKLLGDHHIEVAQTLNNLAGAVSAQNPAAAEPMYREAVAIMNEVLSGDHVMLATALDNLGLNLSNQGKYKEAEAYVVEALKMRRRLFNEDHVQIAASLANLGQVYMSMGLPRDAEPLLRESVEIRRRIMPKGSWYTASMESLYADCLVTLGRFEDAEPLQLAAYRRVVDQFGKQHPYARTVASRIEALYDAWGKPEAAKAFLDSFP